MHWATCEGGRCRGRTPENEHHDEVGDAASQIAPPARGGIGQANNLFGKRLSAPYLAGDERGEAATDEQAAGDEAARVGDTHDADDEWTGDEETNARPLRAPMTSHTVPMIRRATMVPATEEMFAA